MNKQVDIKELYAMIKLLLKVSPQHEGYIKANYPSYFEDNNNEWWEILCYIETSLAMCYDNEFGILLCSRDVNRYFSDKYYLDTMNQWSLF